MAERKTPDEYAEAKIAYAHWRSLPESFKKHKTQKAFAEYVGVSEEALRLWRNEPEQQELSWKVALHQYLVFQPELVAVSIEAMLQEKYWQERVAHRRYDLQPLLAMQRSGFFQGIDGQDTANGIDPVGAFDLLASYSPQEQQHFAELLRLLGHLPAAAGQEITTAPRYYDLIELPGSQLPAPDGKRVIDTRPNPVRLKRSGSKVEVVSTRRKKRPKYGKKPAAPGSSMLD